MTTEEFKKLKPEYKDVEGDQLWNAMEDYYLQQQEGTEILKQIMPFWKTHTLEDLYLSVLILPIEKLGIRL